MGLRNKGAEKMTQKTLSQSDLRQFTGTEHCYRHNLVRRVLFTDGVKLSNAG